MSLIDPSDKKYLKSKLKNLSKLSSSMDSVYARILLRDDPRLDDNLRNLTVSISYNFKAIYERYKEMDRTESSYKTIGKYLKELKSLLARKEWSPDFTPELSELINFVTHTKEK